MRPVWGDDYSYLLLCICYTDRKRDRSSSAHVQTLPSVCLYAINGGVDEKTERAVLDLRLVQLLQSTLIMMR